MNILLWIVQSLLALLYLAGGAYKTFSFAEVAEGMPALPLVGWQVLGVIEIVGGLLLVIPAALKWMPSLTPLAALVLTLETLLVSAIYARYSLAIAATNPLVWSVVMALLVGFVAYGRYVLEPIAA